MIAPACCAALVLALAHRQAARACFAPLCHPCRAALLPARSDPPQGRPLFLAV